MNNNISVIIPFYNSIDTLSVMLDSILNGTILPSEIILVDDGSTDKSIELANEYANKNHNIKVFSQHHNGVSAARNLGLSKATGNWISFLDADDYIEPDMFSKMLQAIDTSNIKVDGCICGYYTHINQVTTEYSQKNKSTFSSQEILKAMFTDDSVRGFICTRLFSSKLIKDYRFDTNVPICEDLLFQSKFFTDNLLNFTFVPKPLYHYVQNKGSATNSYSLFLNGKYIYKPAYFEIYNIIHEDYVWTSYNNTLEYSMYSLLKHYNETGDDTTRREILLLQKELKSTKSISSKSKRRIAFELAPFIYRHFMK